VFYSIVLTEDGRLGVETDFVLERLDGLARFSLSASRHLQGVLGVPAGVADEGRVVWGEEITFWGGREWSILFSEGLFDICQPYGVMVNFSGDRVTGFDDLSGAQEA
jgi:hypothetical protein